MSLKGVNKKKSKNKGKVVLKSISNIKEIL
jgi:hypothetical protein